MQWCHEPNLNAERGESVFQRGEEKKKKKSLDSYQVLQFLGVFHKINPYLRSYRVVFFSETILYLYTSSDVLLKINLYFYNTSVFLSTFNPHHCSSSVFL